MKMKRISALLLSIVLLFIYVVPTASAAESYKFSYPLTKQRLSIKLDKDYTGTFSALHDFRNFSSIGLRMDYKVDTKGNVKITNMRHYISWEVFPVNVNEDTKSIVSLCGL